MHGADSAKKIEHKFFYFMPFGQFERIRRQLNLNKKNKKMKFQLGIKNMNFVDKNGEKQKAVVIETSKHFA